MQTNGIETYYERRGEGPTVVFVHASIMDHAMWDDQVDALADDYETVVYDVRGHGRTGGSTEPVYPMDLYAADLHALLAALDVDRPVLCGLSMGGLIAEVYAATHPDDIAGLVLAEAWTPPVLTLGDRLLRRVLLPVLVPAVRLVGYERVERAEVWVAERAGSGVAGDYGAVERAREGGPGMTTDEFAKVLRSMTRFHEVPVDLSAITVPTLVLYGENGFSFVKRHATAFAAHVPTVDVVEVPDAGHAANLDNPDAFTAALRAFLDRTHAADGAATDDTDAGT